MLFDCFKYLKPIFQRSVLLIGLIFAFATTLPAQTNNLKSDTANYTLNPLLRSSFKHPVKASPVLTEYIKPTKYELMRWPNYPLTAAQIEERDRINDLSPGKQLAHDIAETFINGLLNGSFKKRVATTPRF